MRLPTRESSLDQLSSAAAAAFQQVGNLVVRAISNGQIGAGLIDYVREEPVEEVQLRAGPLGRRRLRYH